MNEFEVIDEIRGLLPAAPPEVLVPIGDDCAVFRLGGEMWVAAADMLVEGRHFEDWASPEDVGYKAVAVNVSDVAAMGARPRFVLISGGTREPGTALEIFRGVAEACEEFGVYPLGGDTTRAASLTIDVSILGSLEDEPVLRSGAREGDLVAVSGELGAAASGFFALQSGKLAEVPPRLVRRQLRPEPRVEVGRAAARLGARAMIDLSDGLASDARHIHEKSAVGCRIDLGLLPISDDVRGLSASLGLDAAMLAATGGEDYELLITAPESAIEALSREVDAPITVIGEMTGEDLVFTRDGERVEDLSGWDHFA